MKRLLTVTLALVLVVFMLPLITLKNEASGSQEAPDGDAALVSAETKSFDERTVVSLYHNGEVSELTIHEYLVGVVAAEMPASFPAEALKAQALAARTYTLYKMKLYSDGMAIPDSHCGAQLCSDYTHCKGFADVAKEGAALWGEASAEYLKRIEEAVSATSGIIATYNGEPIAAVFHSVSSKRTESAISVWGTDTPYLVSVESPGSEASSKYKSEVQMTAGDFKELMLKYYPEMSFDCPEGEWFRDSHRSEAGGVMDVLLGGVRISGTWFRQVMGLNSTNFTYTPKDGMLIFNTTGYGHGVGMSQYGAKALAEEGKTYDEIIKWYYTGVDLTIKS